MNIYTIYADLKEHTNPNDFVNGMTKFLENITQVQKFRITRMKLGFRSSNLGEFRIDMEFNSMQDLDDAMEQVLWNQDTINNHCSFDKFVDADSLDHFLYRDYPDEQSK